MAKPMSVLAVGQGHRLRHFEQVLVRWGGGGCCQYKALLGLKEFRYCAHLFEQRF